AQLGGRDASRRRGLPPARRGRLRLDRQRTCARKNPGRNRYRRYHHGRSTDRPRGYLDIVKRLSLVLSVLLAAGFFAAAVLADDTPPPPPTTTTPVPALVPDGVSIAGVAVGGLAQDAAVASVQAAFQQPVTLR